MSVSTYLRWGIGTSLGCMLLFYLIVPNIDEQFSKLEPLEAFFMVVTLLAVGPAFLLFRSLMVRLIFGLIFGLMESWNEFLDRLWDKAHREDNTQ